LSSPLHDPHACRGKVKGYIPRTVSDRSLQLLSPPFHAPFANDSFLGLSLFVAELAGVFYTGGSLNPARSFGPAVVSHNFPGYHWIYWVGPCMGSALTAGYFRFVKFMNYEEANEGQDSADGEFKD